MIFHRKTYAVTSGATMAPKSTPYVGAYESVSEGFRNVKRRAIRSTYSYGYTNACVNFFSVVQMVVEAFEMDDQHGR